MERTPMTIRIGAAALFLTSALLTGLLTSSPARALPPTVTNSPGYDARLAESRKAAPAHRSKPVVRDRHRTNKPNPTDALRPRADRDRVGRCQQQQQTVRSREHTLPQRVCVRDKEVDESNRRGRQQRRPHLRQRKERIAVHAIGTHPEVLET